MGMANNSQVNRPSIARYFYVPSRTRKYVRLTGQQAYESVNNLLGKVSGSKILELSQKEPLMAKARFGILGAAVTIRVFPEKDVSALDIAFSYKRARFAVLAFAVIILLGLVVFQNIYTNLGFVLIPFLCLPVFLLNLIANNSAVNFLDLVNRTFPFIEKEFAHKALKADRERWEAHPKDTEVLYKRLGEKYVRTWGSTKVLEYKIKEYQELGLTRNEAIRKAAEEEGVN